MAYLEGKKTYIVTVLVALYGLIKAFGIIETTPDQDIAVYTFLAALFGASLRNAIGR